MYRRFPYITFAKLNNSGNRDFRSGKPQSKKYCSDSSSPVIALPSAALGVFPILGSNYTVLDVSRQ
jgi:hypothetical protein